MSAVLKPLEQPDSHSAYAASIAADRPHLQVVSTAPPSAETIAFPTPSQRDRPVWLKLLMMGQRVSFVMAALTVTGALSAYALTVDHNRRLTTVDPRPTQLLLHRHARVIARLLTNPRQTIEQRRLPAVRIAQKGDSKRTRGPPIRETRLTRGPGLDHAHDYVSQLNRRTRPARQLAGSTVSISASSRRRLTRLDSI